MLYLTVLQKNHISGFMHGVMETCAERPEIIVDADFIAAALEAAYDATNVEAYESPEPEAIEHSNPEAVYAQVQYWMDRR